MKTHTQTCFLTNKCIVDGTPVLSSLSDSCGEEDYKRMLINVIDANYGTSVHDIGSGDGIPEHEAEEIKKFWSSYLDHVQKAENLV